jgi:hypothetical protein
VKDRLRIYRHKLLSCISIAAVTAITAAVVVTTGAVGQGSAESAAVISAQPISIPAVDPSVVDMAHVPAAAPGKATPKSEPLPFLGAGPMPAAFAAAKEAARTSSIAPKPAAGAVADQPAGVETPATATIWDGLSASYATCWYFAQCQPPDMALAAGGGYVLEGVNASFAVYSQSGALQSGWPKTAQDFFGIPNNNCDSSHFGHPFLTDPRALYDPNTGRYFVAMLQIEGTAKLGVNCPHLSGYWIAVSQTRNPNGAWFIYFYNFGFVTGSARSVDYTMIGLSPKSLTLGGDIYPNCGCGFNVDNFIFSADKSKLIAGLSAGLTGFHGLHVGTTLMNTVQPVNELGSRTGPVADLFAASFDQHTNSNCSSAACSGIELFAIGNPLQEQAHGQVLSQIFTAGLKYALPPNAPDGSYGHFVSTGDTRISGTPVYKAGAVWGALNTNLNNGTQNVPALYWFALHPVLNHGISGCSLCVSLTGASFLQQAYFYYGGTNSAYYAALMPDAEGNVFMDFDFSNAVGTHPSAVYASRRTTEADNRFSDAGRFVGGYSTTATSDSRWGDYSAAAWDPVPDLNFVAGEFSNGSWGTRLARVAYCLACTS